MDDALSRAAPCAFAAVKTPRAWEQRLFARHGVRVLFAVNPAMRGSSDGKVEAGERDGGEPCAEPRISPCLPRRRQLRDKPQAVGQLRGGVGTNRQVREFCFFLVEISERSLGRKYPGTASVGPRESTCRDEGRGYYRILAVFL